MSDTYTKYPRPGSGGNGRDGLPPATEDEATDFASLTAPPTTQQRARKKEEPTDFHSLTGGRMNLPKAYQPRSATDLLLAFLAPFMILVMVASVVLFLLDVRFVYTEVHDANLRFVAVMFILGVVALNRVIARDGKDESILYIVGLGLVIGLYTLATTGAYDVGSVARNFMNRPGIALAFNMTIVSFLWWLTNRLTHECCVDSNPYAGDIGMLTGTARKARQAIERKPPPARRELPPGVSELDAIDPLEWKKPEKRKPAPAASLSERLPKRHPGISIFYFSVPVMFIFAAGQRVVQHGGEPMILAGHFYVGCYTVAALSLLMLTSLAGLREYFRERRVRLPGGIGPFWIGLGMVMIAMVLFGATALPWPDLPPIAYVDEHKYDPWRRDYSFTLLSPGIPAGQALQQSRFMERVGQGVLVGLGLFILYGAIRGLGAVAVRVARRRDRYPRFVVRFFDRLEAFLERIARVPELPKRRRRPRRISRDVSLSAKITNPMLEGASLSGVDPRWRVERCYDALCALAHDLGVPRRPDQTPYEFVRSIPRELESLKEEAYELTDLYVRLAYSPAERAAVDDRIEDRLRKFWISFERLRNRVVK